MPANNDTIVIDGESYSIQRERRDPEPNLWNVEQVLTRLGVQDGVRFLNRQAADRRTAQQIGYYRPTSHYPSRVFFIKGGTYYIERVTSAIPISSCHLCGAYCRIDSEKQINSHLYCYECFPIATRLQRQCESCHYSYSLIGVSYSVEVTCEQCGKKGCRNCFFSCYNCDRYFCRICQETAQLECQACGRLGCSLCLPPLTCEHCNRVGCNACVYDEGERCSECARSCYFCGTLVNMEDAETCDYCSCVFCSSCVIYCESCLHTRCTNHPCRCVQIGTRIHNYSYRPDWQFFAQTPEPNPVLYMGMELELLLNSRPQLEVPMKRKFISIWKADSSINGGAELVSAPMTLKHWKTLPIKEMLQDFQNIGVKGYYGGSCGLHVHVSREDLSWNNLRYLMNFFSANRSALIKFSQRTERQLERWASLPSSRQWDTDNRYQAINFTNEETIEYRLFRSTVFYPRVAASLEFCDAITRYSLLEPATTSWKKFLEYCEENQYEELIGYMANASLLTYEQTTDTF